MAARDADLLPLEGGSFLMGSEDPGGFPADGEGPVRRVDVEPFRMAPYSVTTGEFAEFVEATEHRTTAERLGWSFVFAGLLPDDFPPTQAVVGAPWWRKVEGADWRQPEGPGSSIEGRREHPVVHVSWTDARAYCGWAGGRLPTESEWEFAARGGLEQKRYPWGDELTPGGEHRCNIWQGTFPSQNTRDDGFYGTAPVDSFPPNGLGLHNTSGNAWEWCADWFDPVPGPERGKVIRGGSYLCHHSYCNRYRVAARSRNTPVSTTGHMGFRLAADAV
jgi:formylglycine-generating enzyme